MNRPHWKALAPWLASAAMALLPLLSATAQAQEAAVVKRATQLRDSPAENGASVAPLEANAVVTRTSERKGPWTKVSTSQGATGWVHMFDLGLSPAQPLPLAMPQPAGCEASEACLAETAVAPPRPPPP